MIHRAMPNGPKTIADFFTCECLPWQARSAQVAKSNAWKWLWLLTASPPADVYDVLATDEGVDRAFAKLDTIKDMVVWWEAGAQPPQLLADGEVAMTTAYNGRIFNAVAGEGTIL